MKNKKAGFLLVLICILIITSCSTGPKDLTAGKTAQKIVEESFDKWYQLNNYDMDMTTRMKFSTGQDAMDMSMSGKITAFQKPMKMKMAMEAAIPGMADKMKIEQYMMEQDQKVILYQLLNGQWQKLVINDPAMSKMMTMDPRDNLKLFMDNLSKAELLGEEVIGERKTVKIDLVASGKIFEQILKGTAGNSLGLGTDFLSSDILSKIGDMKYIIWIDKTTLETVKCQMDLSENMRNLGNALAESQNTPKEMKEIFKNMEMTVEYTVSNQNKAQDFTIPEEAKNAKEVPYGKS
ncbi:MAG: hypothetical protein GX434_10930 [Peptococcaceae bacterium]|nr:hypothetical protein [Peptococcaceae bacterium]